jgi:hypothetical protein
VPVCNRPHAVAFHGNYGRFSAMPNLNHINSAVPAELAAHFPAILVPLHEASRISGYSRSEIYRRLASGDLEGVKIGRSLRITTASLCRSIAALPRAQFAQPKAA